MAGSTSDSLALNLVILTGAGISAESGVATFRDAGGLWEGHRIEDVATPEAFAVQPEVVHQFYNMRRAALARVQPNRAHLALAELERRWRGEFLLITQNVDDLHERAGSSRLVHMHGELKKARCEICRSIFVWEEDLTTATPCPHCGRAGRLRPHIVWFGEMPLEMDRLYAALEKTDLFLAIGTSGQVYPAAGFVDLARATGAHCIEINAEPTGVSPYFHERRHGPATLEVTRWVQEQLAAAGEGTSI